MRKVLVYDDETKFATGYKADLEKLPEVRSAFEIETIDNSGMEQELAKLDQRRKEARASGRKAGDSGSSGSVLDGTDVFIVDMDLIESPNPFLTGDRISYLARCFSACRVIVGLSRFHKFDFDLGLKPSIDTFADVSVGYKDVANTGLWTDHWEGFRPWSWPNVPLLLDQMEKRVASLEGQTGSSILDKVGLQSIADSLPPSARGFLVEDPKTATFESFVTESKRCLRDDDKPIDDSAVARIGAARVGKWIEGMVLPGQDILTDAPHLVSRYPRLLKGDPDTKESWDATAHFNEFDKLGLDHDALEDFRATEADWLSRPMWFGVPISNDPRLKDVKEPWDIPPLKFAFCEDASAFYPVEECTKFVSDVESSFAERYLKRFEPLRNYSPSSNFVL